MRIDLNADLGEGYGPWTMGEDALMLDCVTSAIACGGHAGDPETMFRTLRLAAERGVTVGAHPGYADREGFGQRVIPMQVDEVARMVAAQVGALMALARLAGTAVRYVKPHGALGNLAAADAAVASAVAAAVHAIDPTLAVLAISGTQLETAARAQRLTVCSEIFAGFAECVPAFVSLLIDFDPLVTDLRREARAPFLFDVCDKVRFKRVDRAHFETRRPAARDG